MNTKKLKSSRQRNLILGIVRANHLHPTADDVFLMARKKIPNISLATVYRNLNILREKGKIKEFHFDNGIRRYDGDLRDHCHVHCVECGKVVDMHHGLDRVSCESVSHHTGFRIHALRLEFLGICPNCQLGHEQG